MARYDLISPRARKDGKTYWHKVGAAFPRDKGGFSLVFDSLPLPDAEGRVSVLMSEPLESDGGDRRHDTARQAPAVRTRDLDDEIPF
jgi:hypothetical protein